MKRSRCAVLVLAALGAASPAAAQETPPGARRAPLKICVLEHNLPYSERSNVSGFDIAVAAAVAGRTGHRVVPVWSARGGAIQEIDDSDIPTARLARGDCDAIFSVPGPAPDTLRGNDALRLGAPYYGAAFELLACRADVPAELPALRDRTVAIHSQTVAHFAALAVAAEPRNYFTFQDAFRAVLGGDVDAGLLWGPSIGWQLRLGRTAGLALRDAAFAACAIVPDYEPPAALRWNQHVATRAESTRLRTLIDEALGELDASGELAELAGDWGIPWHRPFDRAYSQGALDELRRGAGQP